MAEILSPAGTPSAGAGAGAADGLIKDTTTQTFMDDVVQASQEALVLVDFWAPWCGPCKQLTPVLEKVVGAAGGKVRLVKMDIDKHPEIAGQLGVQSIPAVFAFSGGRPLDAFAGALPEGEIRKFIERHAPDAFSGGSGGLDAARAALDAGDIVTAGEMFATLIEQDGNDVEAIAGLADVRVATGDLEGAQELLDGLPADKAQHASVCAVRAKLDLAKQSEDAGDIAPLRTSVAANPDDHQARLDLAVALGAGDQREEAIEELLELFRRDREWDEQAAHRQLMTYFEAWGPTDPAVKDGRKRLSRLIFS
ncbi:MAG: co-chaperone YbbN [Pseudomonadota bacterium]